mmetsp:Transcript_11923/g.28271  ORF Transcript_11923/g.28271 Transcript_11923/m.28271 type:complete len:250 (-) Transcript_11923:408-1157(-)
MSDGAGGSWVCSVDTRALRTNPAASSFVSAPETSRYECLRLEGSKDAFRCSAFFLVRTSAVTRAAALSMLGALTMYMSWRRSIRPMVAEAHTICSFEVEEDGSPLYRPGPGGGCARDSHTSASRSSCASGLVVLCSRRVIAVVVCSNRSTSSRMRVLRLPLRASATRRYKICSSVPAWSSSSSSPVSSLRIPSLLSRILLACRCLSNRRLASTLVVEERTFLISFRNCTKSFGVPAINVGSWDIDESSL